MIDLFTSVYINLVVYFSKWEIYFDFLIKSAIHKKKEEVGFCEIIPPAANIMLLLSSELFIN